LPPGNALVHYNNPSGSQTGSNGSQAHNRVVDSDSGYERPPPKGNAELFNPKTGARKQNTAKQLSSPGGIEYPIGSTQASAQTSADCEPFLTTKFSGMGLEDQPASGNPQQNVLPPGENSSPEKTAPSPS